MWYRSFTIAVSFFAFVVMSDNFASASPKTLTFAQVGSSPLQTNTYSLIEDIYRELGISLNFVRKPGLRSLEMSNSGELDGEIFRIWSVGERYENLLRVPTSLLDFRGYAYTLNGQKINSADDLHMNMRIGIQRGIVWAEKMVEGRKGIVRADRLSDLAHRLSDGAIDVVLSSEQVFQNEFERLKLKGNMTRGAPINTVTVYHYLNKKHESLVPKVDAVIQKFKKQNKVQEFEKKLKN